MSQLGDISGALDSITGTINDTVGCVANGVSHLAGSLSHGIGSVAASVANRLDKMQAPPPSPPPSQWSFGERGRKIAVVVAIGVVGTAAYMVFAAPRKRKGRRFARTAPDGGRSEVVVLVCSPVDPLSGMIAQDLNIRGFIVYMTATPEEQEFVLAEKSSDIRPLSMCATDPVSVAAAMQKLDTILRTPVASLAGATPHQLTLAGAVVLPDMHYPAGPLETTPPHAIAHAVHSKLLGPLTVLSGGLVDLVRRNCSRIVIVTPTINSSITPAFHSFESMSVAALSSLSLSLYRELRHQNIPVTQLKLGSFDTGHNTRSQQQQIVKNIRADILSWPDSVRPFYAGSYAASAYLQTQRPQGSKLSQLYLALFKTLTMPDPPRVSYVGRGSRAYENISAWTPEWLMTFFLSSSSNMPEDA